MDSSPASKRSTLSEYHLWLYRWWFIYCLKNTPFCISTKCLKLHILISKFTLIRNTCYWKILMGIETSHRLITVLREVALEVIFESRWDKSGFLNTVWCSEKLLMTEKAACKVLLYLVHSRMFWHIGQALLVWLSWRKWASFPLSWFHLEKE